MALQIKPKKLFSGLLWGGSLCVAISWGFSYAAPFTERALTDQPGDPEKGLRWVIGSEKGNCLLCHRIQQIDDDFQGNIGPELSHVGQRLTADEIRFRIIDPKRLNPNTVMPAYYQTKGLKQVSKTFEGKTVLSAQEIEDIVAYLSQLPVKD